MGRAVINIWWSVGLSVYGLIGLYIAGKKSHWGWFIGLTAQIAWFIFAISTKQYGFILSALGYGAVYWKNWHRWRKEMRLVEHKA